MQISVYTMTVETFLPLLNKLAKQLDKATAYAAAKKFDTSVLANARLAPDMFSLIKQVQLATDFAKSGTARLAGIDPPKFEDNEQTFDELQSRIRKTIDFVSGVKADSFKGAEDRDIVIPLRDTKLEFKGLDYLRNWALPNFYFHLTAAYSILRHNGVDLGKRDFLPAG
ncbi:MAG TPA: DUF1993 domain-containing protein [Steroidobacteraceae bacterium]|nr:DUF1993 domain-containing protein [Steroidobacteraceae bacterium]